jgi:hypothetical protein
MLAVKSPTKGNISLYIGFEERTKCGAKEAENAVFDWHRDQRLADCISV